MPIKFDLSPKEVAGHLGGLITGRTQRKVLKGSIDLAQDALTADMKTEDFKEFLFLTEMLSSAIHVNGDVSKQQREELSACIDEWKRKSSFRSRMTEDQANELHAVLDKGYIPFQEIVSAFNANASSYDERKTQKLREYLNKIININNRQDTIEGIYLFRINLLLQGHPKLPLYYVYDDIPLQGNVTDLVSSIAKSDIMERFPATSGEIKANEMATVSPGNDLSLITLDELTKTDLEESFESELIEALRLGGAKRVVVRTMQSTQEDKSVTQATELEAKKGFFSGKSKTNVTSSSSDMNSKVDEREYTYEGSNRSLRRLLFGERDSLKDYVDRSQWLKNDPEIRNMVLARSGSKRENALTGYQYSGTINKTAQLALDIDIALSASKGKLVALDASSKTQTKLRVQSQIKREVQVEF